MDLFCHIKPLLYNNNSNRESVGGTDYLKIRLGPSVQIHHVHHGMNVTVVNRERSIEFCI